MSLFKRRTEKELDAIIQRFHMNMSNNYKDNAQADLKDLEKLLEEVKSDGKIKPRIAVKYDAILRDLKEKMQGYSHKDQKPYWQ